MFELASDQRSLFRDLADRLSSGQQTSLDPGDERDRRVIENFLDLSNKRSDRYPALHKGLAKGAPPPDVEHDLRFVDLGATGAGGATAQAWHGAQGGSVVAGSAALVLDSESGEPLAFGSATRVGEALSPAGTDPEGAAAPAGDSVTGLAFYHAQKSPDAAPSFGVTMLRRPIFDLPADVAPTVLAPESSVHDVVKIAIGRTEGVNDCSDVDYCYIEPEQNLLDPNLLVPFAGSMSLPSAITGVDSSGHITNLTTVTQVYSMRDYRQCVMPTDLDSHVTAPEPATSPGKLVWTFPFDGKGQAKTESLQYQGVGQIGGGSGVIGWFYFEFNVPLEGFEQPYPFSICSSGYSGPVSPHCTLIKELSFYWHCLVGGTEVTLADGTKRAIEDVDNTVRVRTGMAEGTLGVEATTRGMHRDDGGPASGVCVLATEGGRKLTLTIHHPVVTPNGPVMATDLATGSTILTETGPERIASVEKIACEAPFFNLKLVDSEDRAQGINPAYGTFIANGIVVGDSAAQSDHYRSSRIDLDYMIPRLPEAYHRDYESAVEDTIASR